MNLILISLAPVFIIAIYIYYRDKYEKEPWRVLARALIIGILITLPIILLERLLSLYLPYSHMSAAAYNAFIVASFSEESIKYLGFMLFIWTSRHFNEKFDGIVYAVFISLGFALVENILYVVDGGISVGLIRSLTAVPAHALFGILMGFYFGMAKFFPAKRVYYLLLAWFLPWLFHGFYDFCLMSEHYLLLILFLPFLAFLWFLGFRKMKYLSERSIYRNDL
ncbi:MAG: PrsW family glutamic-type intramembrane protease [Bacteroidota bacterium]|nr:PrsW family glutamic-type intramembrane protease [Bacteroidota bacterium]